MHVGMICPSLAPTGGGVALVNYAVQQELLKAGHEVSVMLGRNASQEAARQAFGECDVLFAYTAGYFSLIADLPQPKLCAMVDLDWQVEWYRRQYDARESPVTYPQLAYYHNSAMIRKKAMIELLQGVQVVEHAYHHAKWLKAQGIDVEYTPMPVFDPGAPVIQARECTPEHRLRILCPGHVRGIATLSGLYYLEAELLPLMEAVNLPFELHITGADTLPRNLALLFACYHPNVKVRGYVDDITAEFRAADVLLVPTPIDLGFRTRIAEGMGNGCLIVTHVANSLGMPELKDGYNGLVGQNANELVGHLNNIWSGRYDEVKMRDQARDTFVRYFDSKVSVPPIIRKLEGLAHA